MDTKLYTDLKTLGDTVVTVQDAIAEIMKRSEATTDAVQQFLADLGTE